MQLISIKNYASYETQVVNALSPRINVVLGKNGQGKSNFFKGTPSSILAIYFALTGRIKFNESQYQSSRHVAHASYDVEGCRVSFRGSWGGDLFQKGKEHLERRKRGVLLQAGKSVDQGGGAVEDRQQRSEQERVRVIRLESGHTLRKPFPHRPAGENHPDRPHGRGRTLPAPRGRGRGQDLPQKDRRVQGQL